MIRSESRAELKALPETLALSEQTLPEIWDRLHSDLSSKSPFLATHLRAAKLPAIFGPNSLVIRFPSDYSQAYDAVAAEPALIRIKESLQRIVGTAVSVKPELQASPARSAGQSRNEVNPAGQASERKKQLMNLPLMKKAADVLGAQFWSGDEAFNPAQSRSAPATASDEDEAPAPEPEED